MNYRHIYHAGNFADVAKHVGLLYCLNALKRKDAAFFVLDSHAGRGFYDMQAPEAQKSGEAERGVQRLIVNALGEKSLADYFARNPCAARQTAAALSRLTRTDRAGAARPGPRLVRGTAARGGARRGARDRFGRAESERKSRMATRRSRRFCRPTNGADWC